MTHLLSKNPRRNCIRNVKQVCRKDTKIAVRGNSHAVVAVAQCPVPLHLNFPGVAYCGEAAPMRREKEAFVENIAIMLCACL